VEFTDNLANKFTKNGMREANMSVQSLEKEEFKASHYDHSQYETRRRFLRFLIRNIGFTLFARVDHVEGLENIPVDGPAILMINHINFIDPIAVMNVIPRRNIVPMAKVEVYDYPLIGIFPRLYWVIPVRREEVDRRAIQLAFEVLRAGEIILLAPEAHRHTELQQGKEGVAYLASRSGAPIIPVAIDHTIGFPTFRYSKRWSEPGASIKFGRPIHFRSDLKRANREQLHQMTEEAMYILAEMLPENRRGFYSDLSLATRETIEDLPN
jgi:1-acyl-sn-glycerol-3-phosphate acyltransferase